jgi:hypothetical protein
VKHFPFPVALILIAVSVPALAEEPRHVLSCNSSSLNAVHADLYVGQGRLGATANDNFASIGGSGWMSCQPPTTEGIQCDGSWVNAKPARVVFQRGGARNWSASLQRPSGGEPVRLECAESWSPAPAQFERIARAAEAAQLEGGQLTACMESANPERLVVALVSGWSSPTRVLVGGMGSKLRPAQGLPVVEVDRTDFMFGSSRFSLKAHAGGKLVPGTDLLTYEATLTSGEGPLQGVLKLDCYFSGSMLEGT